MRTFIRKQRFLCSWLVFSWLPVYIIPLPVKGLKLNFARVKFMRKWSSLLSPQSPASRAPVLLTPSHAENCIFMPENGYWPFIREFIHSYVVYCQKSVLCVTLLVTIGPFVLSILNFFGRLYDKCCICDRREVRKNVVSIWGREHVSEEEEVRYRRAPASNKCWYSLNLSHNDLHIQNA